MHDLVGFDRAATVESHLEQNKKNVEHRTEMLIERARQRRAQYEAGTLPARVAADWSPGNAHTAGLRFQEPATCPACGEAGIVEGDDSLDMEVRYEQMSADDYEAVVDVTASAEYFSCSECGLVLDNYELVEQAGLDTTFATAGDTDDVVEYEGDYGND